MASIGKVSLKGLTAEDFQYTFLMANGVTIEHAGMAAMAMSNVANTAKLAQDGELILGRLDVFEDRVVEGIKVGTVSLKGGTQFLVSDTVAGASPATEVPAPGDYIVGDGDGYVRKATAPEIAEGKRNWLVVEVGVNKDDNTFVIAINV